MGGLSQLARALRSGPSAPAAPPPTGLSSLAARLRTGVVPAANEGPNGKAVALRSSAGAEEYASNDREATKKTALAERALAAATAEPTEARIHAAHAALDEASAWHQRAAVAGEPIGKDVTHHWELSRRLVAQREEIARVRPLEYREAPSGNRGGQRPGSQSQRSQAVTAMRNLRPPSIARREPRGRVSLGTPRFSFPTSISRRNGMDRCGDRWRCSRSAWYKSGARDC